MDILTQLNRAMAYIEEHIGSDPELAGVSSVTAYSPYHFGRLFYYIADMPLSEYIRRRKLSRAAEDLLSTAERVLDIALKYGYDSADSFTRAFYKQHGVTPSAARKSGTMLKIFPPLTFQIKIKGVSEMNWRIEKKEAFEVFGIEGYFRDGESGEISRFWDATRADGTQAKLLNQARSDDDMLGLCGYDDNLGDKFPYMICMPLKDGGDADGFKTARVPEATWAVFCSDGITGYGEQVPQLFSRAYSEWLPTSGFDKADGPDMEIYGKYTDGRLFEEVWIPVVKK